MYQLNNLIKLSLLVFLLGVVFSCKPIYKSFNRVNKTIDYNSKDEYVLKVKERYKIDASRMVFIDSLQKNAFLYHLQIEKISYIYGIIVNKKMKIDNTFVNENNSCYNRITNLINENPELIGEKLITNNLLDYTFTDANNKKISINDDKILVFIFSTRLGNSIIKDIKKVTEEFSSNANYKEFKYYLISID
jgi:hypothetical protein